MGRHKNTLAAVQDHVKLVARLGVTLRHRTYGRIFWVLIKS